MAEHEWASLYEQARAALNTPSGEVRLPALSVMRLITELRHFRRVCDFDWDSDGENDGYPIACNWSQDDALIGSLKGGQNLYAIVPHGD